MNLSVGTWVSVVPQQQHMSFHGLERPDVDQESIKQLCSLKRQAQKGFKHSL